MCLQHGWIQIHIDLLCNHIRNAKIRILQWYVMVLNGIHMALL